MANPKIPVDPNTMRLSRAELELIRNYRQSVGIGRQQLLDFANLFAELGREAKSKAIIIDFEAHRRERLLAD